MSILTRPRPPRPDLPTDPEALEALIEEARRRARRRRRGYAASVLVAAAAGLLAFYGFNHGGGATRPQARPEQPTEAAAAGQGDALSWRLAPGLPGADITELVVNPQRARVMFAATSFAGVFKSTDGARTWRSLSLAPNTSRFNTLAIAPQDPKTLYVGTGRGVFKTTDGGATWQATSADLLGNETAKERDHRSVEGYVYALAVDRRDPDIVYASTWGSGVFKTTDGGASWRSIGLEAVDTVALDPRDPETIYARTIGRPSGVLKSIDGGASWHLVGLRGTTVGALTVDPQHPKTVYAVTDSAGIFKSSDAGASWHAAGLASKHLERLLLDPQHPETLYAQAGARIFKSTDGARTWRPRGLGGDTDLLALHPGHPAKLYADASGRVLMSSNAGRSWRVTGRGPGAASISALAVDARTGTAYGGITYAGIAKRAGGRWQTVSTYQSVEALAVDAQDPDVIYAGTDRPAGILKSTDGGHSWRRLRVPWRPWISDPNLALVEALFVDPQNPNAVYAYVISAADNVSPVWFKSTDGGATWEVADDAFFSTADGADSYPSALAFGPLDSDTLYAYGDRAALFKSTDGGATWQRAGYPFIPASLSVHLLAIDPREPTTLYAAAAEEYDGQGIVKKGKGIFKSTDGGSSWRAVGLKGHIVRALAIDPRQRQTVYAGTDSGLLRSTDGGRSWSRFGRGLPPDGIDARGTLAVDPVGGILYAVPTEGGIYELRLPR
jgi:photosystem II stability/assembly factor-like uncharacterized protein